METNKTHPVTLQAPRPLKSSRALALSTLLFMIPKMILLIPHFIVLYFLMIVMLIVALFAQVMVLITSKYPENLYNIVHGALQWQLRVNMYLLGLTDSYPPFTLK